jgi:hypothetical protein
MFWVRKLQWAVVTVVTEGVSGCGECWIMLADKYFYSFASSSWSSPFFSSLSHLFPDLLFFYLSLQKPLLKESDIDLLYFADVCAGPGGFSEYVLWRKKWHAKGFGMTLKGPNDFKLEDFYSASSELFEPYYGRDTEQGGD